MVVLRPDDDGRVEGTTYPRDRAPVGSVPLGRRLVRSWRAKAGALLVRVATGVGVTLLRPRPDDVVVIRTPGGKLPSESVREVNLQLRRHGWRGVAIVLPLDCAVHVEPPKLKREDRGYRETATYGTDRPVENADARGVITGLPEGGVPPHPLSESGDDDPCAA